MKKVYLVVLMFVLLTSSVFTTIAFQESARIIHSSKTNIPTNLTSHSHNSKSSIILSQPGLNSEVPTKSNEEITTNMNQNKNNIQNYDFKLQSLPKQKTGFKTLAVQNYKTQIGVQLNINGVLKSSAPNDYWVGETVILIREGYANQSVVTGSGGTFNFALTYTVADIGAHNYSVYFGGNPSLFRLPGTVKSGVITVFDVITLKITTDQLVTTVPPNTPYNILITLEHSDTSPFNPATFTYQNEFNTVVSTSAITYSLSEVYTPVTTGTANTATQASASNVPFSSSSISIASNTGSQTVSINIAETVSLANYLAFLPYLEFNSETNLTSPVISNKTVLTVDVNYVFGLSTTVAAVAFDPIKRYQRANQLVNFTGTLTVSGGVSPTTLVGVQYKVTMVYNSLTLVNQLGKTDSNGKFNFKFNLNTSTYNDVTKDIVITFEMNSNNNATIAGVTPKTITQTIKLQGSVQTLTVTSTIPSTTSTYLTVGSQFTITGSVTDSAANPANLVGISIFINDSNLLNVQLIKTQSNSLGQFSVTVTLLSYTTGTGTFNVVIKVDNPLTTNDQWLNPLGLSNSYGSFDYTNNPQFVTQKALGYQMNGINTPIFNITFNGLLTSPTANISLTVRDAFNRAPLGYYIQIGETIIFYNSVKNGGNQIVNATNNGVFTLPLSTITQILNPSGINKDRLTNFEGDGFVFTAKLLDPSLAVLATVTKQFTLFGPDHSKPNFDLTKLLISGDNGSPNSVTISISFLSFTLTADNMRNVTIYYRYSSNYLINSPINATFSGSFTKATMINDTTNAVFTYTVPFRGVTDNGRWVEFYFIAYDLAGNGLNLDGTTRRPPAYDPKVTNIADSRSLPQWNQTTRPRGPASTNGLMIKMGDSSVTPVDIKTAVQVNSTQLGIYIGTVTNGSKLFVVFNAPADATGISFVEIQYRTRLIDPITRFNTTSWGQLSIVNMTNIGGNQFQFEFNSSLLQFLVEVDYRFRYGDTVGNKALTDFVSKVFSGSTTIHNPIVVDTSLPVVTTPIIKNQFGQAFPISPRPLNNATFYELWDNETVSISFNASDLFSSGIGLVNVTLVFTYANGSQIIIETTLFKSTSIGKNAFVTEVYTIPLKEYAVNATIQWSFKVQDKFGNTVNVNAGGAKFVISAFPQIPSGTVITTQTTFVSNGQTFTANITLTTNLSNVNPQSQSFLFIVAAFIFGLGVLILYYRRHSLIERYRRRQREKLLTSRLADITDDIRRLANQGNYRESILLIWQALERAGKEVLQVPRKYNMSVRMYVAQIGSITSVDVIVLNILAYKFEKAKYGKDEITLDDWKEAFDALEVTIQTLIATGAKTQFIEEDDFEDFSFEDGE